MDKTEDWIFTKNYEAIYYKREKKQEHKEIVIQVYIIKYKGQ